MPSLPLSASPKSKYRHQQNKKTKSKIFHQAEACLLFPTLHITLLMNKIRVGIIGAGNNTKAKHIPGFQAIEGVSINAVCNRTLASSNKVATQYGIPKVAAHWQDIIKDPDIDAICIGTWPYLHAEITIAALDAGKHVLTEARMARNTAEAEAMLEASKRHPELVAQIVPAPFSFRVDNTVKALILEEKLGHLREITVTHTCPSLALSDSPMNWRQDFELSGYNVLTMGILHETIQRWLNEDPVWLIADATVFTPRRFNPETGEKVSIKIPDSLSIFGRFQNGSRLVYHLSGVASGTPEMSIRLNGSKGSIRYDILTDKLYQATLGSQDESEVDIPPDSERRWLVEEDFINSIRSNLPVTLTSFEQGVRYMRFTEAVYRSWSSQGSRTII